MNDSKMNASNAQASAQPSVENARDLLVRLYRNIGISAVAAALESSRQPAPEDMKQTVKHELPAVLRDQHLAA